MTGGIDESRLNRKKTYEGLKRRDSKHGSVCPPGRLSGEKPHEGLKPVLDRLGWMVRRRRLSREKTHEELKGVVVADRVAALEFVSPKRKSKRN